MSSLAKALQIKEITIDGNPVTLNTDYISFLVSYLPNLQLLSTMQISEQFRRTAMAWRFSKEQTNSAFLDLSAQVCMNVRREEVISNAKTNWELLRSRTKLIADSANKATSKDPGNNINVLHAQSISSKFNIINSKSLDKTKTKGFGSLTSINENVEAKKIHIKKRSSSSDNLFKLDDAKSFPLEFKLPPILGSIVDNLTSGKLEDRSLKDSKEKMTMLSDNENTSDSDLDSSESHESLKSGLRYHLFTANGSSVDYDKSATFKKLSLINHTSFAAENNNENHNNEKHLHAKTAVTSEKSLKYSDAISENESLSNKVVEETSGVDSCSKSLLSDLSSSSISKNVGCEKSHDKDRIKSAQPKKVVYYKSNRAATARAKFRALALPSPPPQQAPPREREQGRLMFF